jgi:fucose permease
MALVLVLDLSDMGTHCSPVLNAKIPLMHRFFTLAKLLGPRLGSWLVFIISTSECATAIWPAKDDAAVI